MKSIFWHKFLNVMIGLRLYFKWCWQLKEILPWQVYLVSDRELTQEEYDYPNTLEGITRLFECIKELASK